MTIDEVKSQLSSLYGRRNGTYTSSERGVIEQLYYEVFGRLIRRCSCPDKWRDAVAEIYSHIKRNGKMKQKSNYRLRAGIVLQIAGSSQVYTNDNLTDEIAEEFLRIHPKATGRFEVIPAQDNQAEKGVIEAEVAAVEAAEARIADLEAENAALEARIADLEAGTASAEEPQSATEDAFVMNEEARKAIADALDAGKTKTAIRQELAGKEIGGEKLTHRLIIRYIDILTAEK